MNKKTLLFIVIGILAAILGFLLSQKDQPTQTKQPLIVREAASPPDIHFVSDEPEKVIFSYEGESVSLPDDLPVFSYQTNQITTLPTLLGFSSAPITRTDKNQSITIWNETNKELSLFSSASTNNWSYSTTLPSLINQKFTSPTEIRTFVESVISIPTEGSVVFIRESTGPLDGNVSASVESSTIKNYLFSYFINKTYPVADSTFNDIAASFLVDQAGLLHSFSITSFPEIFSLSQKAVLSLQEAVRGLNNNKGRLISAGTGESDSFWGASPTFTEVSLTGVKIIYYPREETKTLTPFFLFSGVAINKNNETLSVEYAVSAIE